MIEVVSLLGVSYSGKSTLAEALVSRLEPEGITVDVIKKDEALRALGRERYGSDDETGGYSIKGFLKHGEVPARELHSYMNEQLKNSLSLGHIAILEGGTRTRSAQAETLSGVELDEDGLRIFLLKLPFREVLKRARDRRKESGRYDDRLPVALAKLYSQYQGMRSTDAPKTNDVDVTVLDASLPTAELVEITAIEILASRA
jgi:adenylate kinase family enzyme